MRMTVHGDAGPLIVKLAGIAGGIRLYDEEIAAVAAAGFRVLALDISGDRRDEPADHPLTWDRFAAEVVTAIDRVGEPRAILWGTSFGCLIALATAARHPERISGLLLSHPPNPQWRPRLHLALLGFAEKRTYPDLAIRLMFTPAFLGLTAWEIVSPALWLRLPRLMIRAVEAATPASTIRHKLTLLFRDPPGFPPPGTMPVEIVAGRGDLVAPLVGVRRLAACIPGARCEVIAWSGHGGAFSRPRMHKKLVVSALRKLTSTVGAS